jgi:hypothetical protein
LSPFQKEKEETVPTLPIVETTTEPTAITHAASTSASAGKRDNEPASTDGDSENAKKKTKKGEKNVSRQVTLPQLSKK